MLIIWAKVYYHFSRLQNFMRTQVQQFDPTTSQYGSWAKASRAQSRIRVVSYALVCNFFLSWSPIYLMGAVAYSMGALAEYPLGLDIIAGLCAKCLPLLNSVSPAFQSRAYVKNLNLADLQQKAAAVQLHISSRQQAGGKAEKADQEKKTSLRFRARSFQEESKCSAPGDLASPPVLLECPTPHSNNCGVNMPVLLTVEEVPTIDVLVPKTAITIASQPPQQPKSSPGSNASSRKASLHGDSESRRASGASDSSVGVGEGGKPRRSLPVDRLRQQIAQDLSLTTSEVIEERMTQRISTQPAIVFDEGSPPVAITTISVPIACRNSQSSHQVGQDEIQARAHGMSGEASQTNSPDERQRRHTVT
eukprot:g78685.t1